MALPPCSRHSSDIRLRDLALKNKKLRVHHLQRYALAKVDAKIGQNAVDKIVGQRCLTMKSHEFRDFDAGFFDAEHVGGKFQQWTTGALVQDLDERAQVRLAENFNPQRHLDDE
jgi:hypothetical protein